MWPFRKKPKPAIEVPSFESVLCIPGPWVDDLELKRAILESTNGNYVAAGYAMLHVASKSGFKLEFCGRDEGMRPSFAAAGKVTGVTEAFLDAIEQHQSVVYLLATTGSLGGAAQLAYAAHALLKAGGIGVKVETAGKAFEKQAWEALLESFQEQHLYELFVVDSLYGSNGIGYSCGMQNLGMRDTIVSGLPFPEAVALIRTFGLYQVIEKPELLPNQTFSVAADAPYYRMIYETQRPYSDALFGNPFGMWRLVRVED